MGKIIKFKIRKSSEDNYINQIHNYYLNNANIYGYDILDESIFNNIDSIMLIKEFDIEYKNKFINMVKNIKLLKRGLIDEIIDMANLTKLFLYLGENIKQYEISDIEDMLSCITNELDGELSLEDDNDFNRKKM